MGRGNVCVRGNFEGLLYIDYDNFEASVLDENDVPMKDRYGYPIHDYELEYIYQCDAVDEFVHRFTEVFPSFRPCDIWLDQSTHAVLENKLFWIAVEDNEWSLAVELLQKEQSYYSDGNIEGLQKRHWKSYFEGMKTVLFEQFEELGIYCGAWTSGRIVRPPTLAV